MMTCRARQLQKEVVREEGTDVPFVLYVLLIQDRQSLPCERVHSVVGLQQAT